MMDTIWMKLTLALALALAGVVWIWLRERAQRRAAEQALQELQLQRDQEVTDLLTELEAGHQRESRMIAVIGVLWKELTKRCRKTLELKERYKQETSERARQAVWLKEKTWEISQLEALVMRVLARWAAEKRANARESLVKELIGAIVHLFGGPRSAH